MQLFNRENVMLMTSVSGHLLTYEFDADYRNWRMVDPISLFDAPIQKACIKGMEKVKVSYLINL